MDARTPTPPPHPAPPGWSWLLARWWAGTLPAPLWRAIDRKVHNDPRLLAWANAARRAEHALSGAPLSHGQLDAIESRLFDALDSATEAPKHSARATAGGLAFASASLALFAVIQAPSPSSADGAFDLGALHARGQLLEQHPLGVKVTCLAPGGTAPLGSQALGARQQSGTLACNRDGWLAFSTTNLGTAPRYAFVLGLTNSGERRWYAPFSKDAHAVRIEAGQLDRALETAADTASMPNDPEVALFVLLSDEPFDGATLERQLTMAEKRGLSVGHVDRLPVNIPLQARLRLIRGQQP